MITEKRKKDKVMIPFHLPMANVLLRVFPILVEDRFGTCFTVPKKGDDGGLVVTALHVIGKNAKQVAIHFGGQWNPYPIRHLKFDCKQDVAIFDIQPPAPKGLGISLREDGTVFYQPVYCLGFPGIFFDQIAYKNISGPAKPLEGKHIRPLGKLATLSDWEKHEIYVDTECAQGFSGGPILETARPNNIIGVITGMPMVDACTHDNAGKVSGYVPIPTGYTRVASIGTVLALADGEVDDSKIPNAK